MGVAWTVDRFRAGRDSELPAAIPDNEYQIASADPPPDPAPLPQALETSSDRAAKHDLAIFIADHVIPTFEAQIDLQKAIIHVVCGRNKAIRNLAWKAHKSEVNMREYIDHTKRLRTLIGESFSSVSLEKVLESLEAVSKLHHALCSFPKHLAGGVLDHRAHPDTRELYEQWRKRQEELVTAFKPFRRDARFPSFYNLTNWRRLGEGFETDA
jgi:hypothetical protein